MSKKTQYPTVNFIFPMYVYPFDLMVSIGQNDEEITGSLKKAGVTKDVEMCHYGDNGAARYTIWPGGRNLCLIRLKFLPRSSHDYGMLSHEILHVVISAIRLIGGKISDCGSSDEMYTYLMSYITEQILKRINKYY